LAGAGANVTLGIPRLREIIMTASRELKTPTMSVPLKDDVTEKEGIRLTRMFTKLTLNELIGAHHGVTVRETLLRDEGGTWERAYFVSIKLHKAERIKTAFGLTLEDIARVVGSTFIPALKFQMKLELRRSKSDYTGDIEVQGGAPSSFIEKVKKKQPVDSDEDDVGGGVRRQHQSNDGSNDMLGEDDDDDDEDDMSEAMGEEDGVTATRTQADGYIDDEAMEINDNAIEEEEDDGDDGQDENEGEGSGTYDDSNLASDSIKVDTKTNTIHIPPLRVDPSSRPLLMVGLVEKAASKTLIRARKKIDQAFINEEQNGRGRCLQTAGINFEEMWKLESVDHSRLMSNDIWAVRCSYGVEAARNTIVDQIRSVFGVYGIEVDPRHLSLIADYMTFGGDYTPMNRTGMREMSSPFLQMSFETTAQFLTHAAMKGNRDSLNSPSANIVVGRPIRHGTGAFSLLVK
jgi:DNA-directed RNA polymerase I subunit RPA1